MMDRLISTAALLAVLSCPFGDAFVVPRHANVKHSNSLLYSEDPMAAYNKAMAQAAGGATAAAAPEVATPPPAPAAATPAPAAPASAAAGGSPSEAINALDASQESSVNSIAAAIPDLAPKPELTWTAETIQGCAATLDARDAAGPANIAWLSSLKIEGKQSALTIYNGPLNDVPHLLSRVCVLDDGNLDFILDFRPRAYGAYELKDADGNYPGPDELGRKAFEYSGNRNDYFNKFVTDDVVAFMEDTVAALEGATPSASVGGEEEALTCGPHKISVTCPATQANIATIAAAREKAANYWLEWATDDQHAHRPGAPINSQHVYDSKYKINAYGALLPVYQAMYGPDDGAKLTAAESGPLDEAYVGGGS